MLRVLCYVERCRCFDQAIPLFTRRRERMRARIHIWVFGFFFLGAKGALFYAYTLCVCIDILSVVFFSSHFFVRSVRFRMEKSTVFWFSTLIWVEVARFPTNRFPFTHITRSICELFHPLQFLIRIIGCTLLACTQYARLLHRIAQHFAHVTIFSLF